VLKKILLKFIKTITQFSFVFLRSFIIGGITVGILILNMNKLTETQYGVYNLVIITSSFVFFPSFFVLLTEFFLRELRKNKRAKFELEKKATESDL
jgi:hypothetical protein